MEIWELLKRLQRQPSAEGIMSGNKAGVQNVDPTPVDVYNFLQGTGAGLAGMPVDLATTAMRPFGYNTPPEQTVGSSEWFGRQMGADPSSRSFTAGTFGSPDPTDALRATAHLDDLLEAMTVLHASPHVWDKVDLSKAGTGEGASAYGHGFYAAENPRTASEYQKKFSSRADWSPEDLAKLPPSLSYDEGIELDVLSQRMMKQGNLPEMEMSRWKELFYARQRYDNAVAEHRPRGHLYELDLPDETIDRMLDWDAPMSRQLPILNRIDPDVKEGIIDTMDRRGMNDIFDIPDAFKGGDLYNLLRHEDIVYDFLPIELPGSSWYEYTSPKQHASAYLNSIGVPGNKYWDGYSRRGKEGTRNFVVFDEKYITPLTRNGQPLK